MNLNLKARDVEIRVAMVEDGAALAEIGYASFREAYEGTCSTEDLYVHLHGYFSAAAIREELLCPGRTYLMATVDEEPAAFVKLREGENPDAVPQKNVLEIQQFYVSPDHQRLGLGGRLMDVVFDFARESAVGGFWLSVWEDADWAVQFYLDRGFEQVGTADFPLGSTVYNDYLMWCPVLERN